MSAEELAATDMAFPEFWVKCMELDPAYGPAHEAYVERCLNLWAQITELRTWRRLKELDA